MYFGQPDVVSFDAEKTRLVEGLRRALNAMQGWSAARRLQYQVTLGVKNRRSEYTQDFGGEAMPEPDSIAMIVAPASVPLPVIKLLYVLRQCDDLCLNAPTARSIIRAHSMIDPCIVQLIRVIKDAEDAGLVRRTSPAGRDLVEADRDSIIGLTLTEQGKRYLDDVLHTGKPGGDEMPRAAAARRP